MSAIKLFLNYIGIYAPVILSFSSIILLQSKSRYLQVYIAGLILNTIFNAILKYAIKDPRPSSNAHILEIAIANDRFVDFDNFGMPSGHAQNCGFNLAFITLVFNSPLITCLYLVLTYISMYQRYEDHQHTLLQLLVGLFVGLSFGYLFYYIGSNWIKGSLKNHNHL